MFKNYFTMKKFVFLFYLISLNYALIAQNSACGTETPTNYQTYERTRAQRGYDITDVHYQHLPICINVYYHIVRKSNGTGGFDVNNLSNVTDILNEAYNPNEIYINYISYDYIDNDNYYTLDPHQYSSTDYYYDNLFSTNRKTNAINIYLVGSLEYGIAGRARIGNNVFAIENDFALTSTMPHELGHCLNLLHTHETYYGVENIPRTGPNANCSVAGDLLCDTPADPNLLNNVDTNCNYTGGNGYSPDTHNYMSYSLPQCRNSFTDGQEMRMRDAIASNPILQNVVGNSCKLADIEGPYNFCSNEQVTYVINNVLPPFNWTTSPNLNIISGNGTNSITVEYDTSQDKGPGYIEVEYYAGKSKKNIYIGTINEGIDAYVLMDDVPTMRVLTKDNGNELEWKVNGFTINNTTGNDWMDIDLSNYSDYCINNQTVVSVRVNDSNSCGWSVYDSMYFDCVDADPWYNIIPPYPNSADTNFKIDFSNKPNGTNFYIYLYNGNQELKFQGYSGNVEKTINTLNLQNGIYYLKVISNGKVKTKQVIINH